jgi:predicted HicB family RNase H-like nuclease
MNGLRNVERVKSQQINIRVDPRTKRKLFLLSRQKGVSASELIRQMINDRSKNYKVTRAKMRNAR